MFVVRVLSVFLSFYLMLYLSSERKNSNTTVIGLHFWAIVIAAYPNFMSLLFNALLKQ